MVKIEEKALARRSKMIGVCGVELPTIALTCIEPSYRISTGASNETCLIHIGLSDDIGILVHAGSAAGDPARRQFKADTLIVANIA